ncbi:MAG TPA: hypothetical protein VFE53_23560 [Mucilaginibacter sp.]|jgi:hypothetical protein|nr:hypothetical protein [Mucilaginibacter sp.]
MEQFSSFDPSYTGDLVVSQKGTSSTYTLTDGMKDYGELSYPNDRLRIIKTAQHNWNFVPGKSYKPDIVINDMLTGQTIAVAKTSTWGSKITVEFTDGQIFKFHRPFVFTKKPYWHNEQFGNVLSFEYEPVHLKLHFKVMPEQSAFRNNDHLLIMTFLAVHLVAMRRVSGFRGMQD